MQTQTGGDVRVGIGARLRAARERSRLTPMQIAERLHIDQSVVDALEAEDFESLGAPVYVRGHLKRYAELVGENPGELQSEYESSRDTTALPDLTRIPKGSPTPHHRVLLVPGLAILGVIAVFGSVWGVMRAVDAVSGPAPVQASAQSPPPAAAAQPLPPPSMPVESKPAAAPKPRTASPNERPATETPVVAQAATPEAPPAAPAAPARPAELTLNFTSDSWAEVYDANGVRLFYDVGAANTTRVLTGATPLRVVLGNPAGVVVSVNGREAVIPDAAMRDGEARFVVNRSGRIVRSRIASSGGTP
jgi:cytoskeleton protein RodZ